MVARPAARSKGGARTGVAISTTEFCAVDARLRGSSDRSWRAPLDPPPADGASWPSLAAAFSDLARVVGANDDTVAVSLMPPLTEVRQIDLPPLANAELQRVLSRDASRYFVNARAPQIVGASMPRRGRRSGGPNSVVAAAAGARLVLTIRAAAANGKWTLAAIGPAESAWTAAAVSLWPAFARQTAFMIVAHDDRTDLLQLDSGRLAGVRRFRAGATDADMIADAIGPSGRAGITGSLTPRRELATALAASRVTVSLPTGDQTDMADRGDLLAAYFAGSDAGPLLRTDDAMALERGRTRRTTWILGGAAAALLVASAAIELMGVHRQLDAVRAERAAFRPQLAATLVGRTTVAATYAQLAALDSIERASPQWSAVIATLSESVPDDAHLSAIRAHEDTLVIDGLAGRAKPVFDALEATEGLIDVRAASPVRRELQDNGAALEHFTIGARVTRPVKPIATQASAVRLGPGAGR